MAYPESPFVALDAVRRDLDTVPFVRDYVEVRIDYNVVRCMTGPIVRTATGSIAFQSQARVTHSAV